MIALVKTSFDRKTGKTLRTEIENSIDMTEDEYYEPLVNILMKDEELQKLIQV